MVHVSVACNFVFDSVWQLDQGTDMPNLSCLKFDRVIAHLTQVIFCLALSVFFCLFFLTD